MSATTEVKLTVEKTLATIEFATDNGINVMSRAALRALGEAVEKVAARREVRVTALQSHGKVFVAGADIKEMAGFDVDTARAFSVEGNRIMDALEALPSITVALINGAALGGGCEIAMACDFRIAAAAAKIGLPETSLGLIPGWGGTKRAQRLLGPADGRRLVYSAAPMSADEAAHIGLVDKVVDVPDDLPPELDRLRQALGRGGPHAVAMAKRAMRTGDEPEAFAACFADAEAREGMTAFVEKRPASWMER